MAREASARSGGCCDRWMAPSSNRPMAWLATTWAAGTSARRRRASSSSARSSASAASSNSLVVVVDVVRRRRRIAVVGQPMLAARCPQAAHLRYHIGRTTEEKWGLLAGGLPPGHRSGAPGR